MKALATVFFVLGLVALFAVAEWRWEFVPVPMLRQESEMIIGAWAFSLGLPASLVAALFASIAARRAKVARGQGFLLACCFLVLGFLVVLVA